MPATFDIVALGEVNVDLILSGVCQLPQWGAEVLAADHTMRLGGSTANFACACAALGLRVALVAWVGEDDFGRFLVAELERLGVETKYVRRCQRTPTGITVAISGAEDRAFVTSLGTIGRLCGEDVPVDLLRGARHVHVGSYFLQPRLRPALAELFGEARRAGASTSLDLGYDPAEEWDGGLKEVLPFVDVFMPNEVEAEAITGLPDPLEAAGELAARGPLTVVKMGPDGSCARDRTGTYRQAAFSVDVVDTTGCGDAFNAGFIWARLDGRPVDECLRLGNACGALIATVAGNDVSVLSRQAAEALAAGG